MPKGKKSPSEEEVKAVIDRLLPTMNLYKTGVKAFIELLQTEFNGAIPKSKMSFVKNALTEAVNDLPSDGNEENDEDAEDESSESSSDGDDASSDESASEDSSAPPKKRRAAGRGLSVKKELSPELAAFLGQDTASRTDVVKLLWDYIKQHDLQNPDNKREILLDDRMKDVFGVDTFTMFTMNKYVTSHIHPFKPVDLTASTPRSNKKKKSLKESKKRKLSLSPEQSGKKKRKPKKPGLQPPYQLSTELAAVVGKDILPRPQVVAAIWDYIKFHGLQNPNDKREIICDDKLRLIMGGNDRVTMFNMNRFITQHLVEKLDRSAYNHEEATGGIAEADDDDEEEEEDEDDDDDDDE